MMLGGVKQRVRQGQINRSFVFRLPREFNSSRGPKENTKESDFQYLVVLEPNKESFARPGREDYFIFRDRTGSRDKLRWFRTMFTVTETFHAWGIPTFTYVDLANEQTPHDAFETLKKYLSKYRVPSQPIEKFLEQLAEEMHRPRKTKR